MKRKHTMPFGAEITPDGIRFALWAPSAKSVELICGDRRQAMLSTGQGWYHLIDPTASVRDLYAFAIDGQNEVVPDPASRFQRGDLDRRSSVQNPHEYDWKDASWKGRPWTGVVLYEVHLGTATPEGTYSAFETKLGFLRNLGITAIELMPLAETTGLRTWGYDGVLPFAPNNCYGTPDELKHLIDAAHRQGLMVFLDVVYNHFGPSGNFLHLYAKDFFTERHQTPWGAGINFDGQEAASEVVREFFIRNALYWLEEFHIDGLRLDAVHAIIDNSEKHFLEELADRVRAALPERYVHLVLENENNQSFRLKRDTDRVVSFDAQWNDDYHHCWHVLLTGEDEGYYSDFSGNTLALLGRCMAEGFVYQGDYSESLKRHRGEPSRDLPPDAFVTFLQNHDQIGNRAQGERLTTLTDSERLALARAALFLGPQIPMIFMGDEWGATTPFQFFVNFENDTALEEAVRTGRRHEFERFKSFSGELPDPTSAATFKKSTLDWRDIKAPRHAQILEETRHLLLLRATYVLPLIQSGFVESNFEQTPEGLLEVVWRFRSGILSFLANFGERPISRRLSGESFWHSTSLTQTHAELLPWTGTFSRAPN